MDENKNTPRPDFNIGLDSFHSPWSLKIVSQQYLQNLGYSVGIEWPFSGSIMPIDNYKG
jgi:N-formylglutamate deformylase